MGLPAPGNGVEHVEEGDGYGTRANAVTIGLSYTYDLFVVFSVLTNGKEGK